MQGTREKLIDTARQLFAERGVAHVSLREISRAAEQRNVSALQYHFGDREGLLRAVMEPYHREVDARRNALLDHLDAGEASLRDFAGALVRPSAALLADPGGRQFLRIFGHLLGHPDPRALGEATGGEAPSLKRWRKALEPWIPEEAVPLHRRFTAIQLTHVELGRRAELSRREHGLFISHLVDLAAAILAAPISEETRRLLAQRSGRRNP
jgi:AcrR family transcriptional regulator